jgi:hypothetical protein
MMTPGISLDRLLGRLPRKPVDLLIVGAKISRESYVLLFTEDHKAEALRTLGRWASDPSLSFTWHTAAVLSAWIRDACCLGKDLDREHKRQEGQ